MSSQGDIALPVDGQKGEATSLCPEEALNIPEIAPALKHHYEMYLLLSGLQELRDKFVHEMHPALRDLFDEVMECVEECACCA
jgi:hypothetical protein